MTTQPSVPTPFFLCPASAKILARLAVLLMAGSALAGCNLIERLSEVGNGPKVSNISNPTLNPNYRPVSMPMPQPTQAHANANSLWRPGARAFFKDQRAHEVGDILTVSVQIKDKGVLNNKTEEKRDNSETSGAFSFLGYETYLNKALPNMNPAAPGALSSTHGVVGDGKINRDEEINVTLAAVIIQSMPNGNLVIAGRQEVRINYELRELTISGIIRPEDISSTNTVSYDKIAEARINYGGRGALSDLQQARYGQQIFEVLFPF